MSVEEPAGLTSCPNQATLAQFHQGRLSERELEVVASHLSVCTVCAGALRGLDQQPTQDVAGAPRPHPWMEWPSLLNEAGWLRMRNAIEGLGGEQERISGLTTDRKPDPSRNQGQDVARWLGLTVGNYVLLSKISQGGMGVVYKARQEPIGRLVALKMILAGVHAGEQDLARFAVEGIAAGRLQHRNVVQIYEFGEHDGLPYYAMELVEGESLQARLKRGLLPFREAADLIRTLALAVQFAHDKQVLHRDLKPANVLLAADGTPKIADFGLAKLLDAEGQGPTRTDVLLGTPSYVAPEQAAGKAREAGPETDVYALGAILYQCLTGKPPFQGKNPQQTLEMVRRQKPVPPSRLRAEVPAGLEHVCLKALEKEPRKRHATALALADDLGHWLAEGCQASRPGGRWLAHAFRWRAALVALVFVVMLGSGVAAYVAFTRSPPAKAVEEPPLEPRPADVPQDHENLQRILADLEAGKKVELLEKGKPVWHRSRAGKAELTSFAPPPPAVAELTVSDVQLALIDLLPDPRCDRYVISAQVRLRQTFEDGEVGLYVAGLAYPGHQADVQFLIRTTFRVGAGGGIELIPHLCSDPRLGKSIHCRLSGPSEGQESQGIKRAVGPWHDLVLDVTPDQVTARWDDARLLVLKAPAIRQEVTAGTSTLRRLYKDDRFIQRLRPVYAPRGALGLYVHGSTASFRSVIVTPIVQ